MSEALLHIDYTTRTSKATEAAIALKENALCAAALIGKVDDEGSQREAVNAQKELARIKKLVEQAEEAAKGPLNELRTAIIDTRKQFVKDIDTEGMRLAQLVGDFQVKEQKRVAAEKALQDAELLEIERRKAVEIAAAPTAAAQDAILEKYSELAKEAVPTLAPTRAAGQVVKADWDIQVTDVWLLARAYPSCVKIEPRLSEIKSLLDAGVDVKGITATRKTTSTVRLGPERRLIEA